MTFEEYKKLNARTEQVKRLKKENLDLRKEYLNKINKEKIIYEQLAKANEIIKNFLHTLKNEDSEFTNALKNTHPVLIEAEQFLKELSE